MQTFISNVQLEISIDSVHRALKILQHLNLNDQKFFGWVKNKLKMRWEIMNQIFQGQNNFIQHTKTGFYFFIFLFLYFYFYLFFKLF